MSRAILDLIQQRYKSKVKREMQLIENSLGAELREVPVKFRYRPAGSKKSYVVEGTVSRATWDIHSDDVTLVVDFLCPERKSPNTTVRKISELYE